jgi:alpha-1,2-mannosyltransferase
VTAPTVTGEDARDAPPQIRGGLRWLERLVAAIDRRAVACCVAGVAILVLLTWFITWHVPTSSWLFSSQYTEGFKDLVYRIRDVHDAQHGITLYSKHNHLEYFVYPPAAIWIFWPLTWVGTFAGEFLWTLTSLLALVVLIAATARFACKWRWAKALAVSLLVATPLSALLLVPVDVHLALGQVGLYLAAAATLDILCVRNRARGVLTGITAALKLYPIIYFAIFALRREWRALGNAVGALVATTAVAWVVLPSDSATYFFHRLLTGWELRHYWHNAHWISSSSSIYTFFFRQPFSGTPPERSIGFALCLVVLCLGVLAAWRQLKEGREVGALLCVALASTIGSPVAWDHYFFWIVLAPFAVVERWRVPTWRAIALGCFGIASLVPLRLARNENLSHRAYDWIFVVIFTARNAFIVVSLLWIVAALIPEDWLYGRWPKATTIWSVQSRTGAEPATSGVRP